MSDTLNFERLGSDAAYLKDYDIRLTRQPDTRRYQKGIVVTFTLGRNGASPFEKLLIDATDPTSRAKAVAALEERASGPPWPDIIRELETILGTGSELPRLSVVEISGLAEPDPMPVQLGGLIAHGYPNIWYGDGGHGKSLLAQAMTMCVALGRPFLDFQTIRENSLTVDYELDVDEHTRRGYRIARGLGLDHPPRGLYYVNATHPFVSIQDEIKRLIRKHDIGLLIIDSFGPACGAENPSAPEVIVPLMQSVRDLGVTTLLIDHQSKMQTGQSYGGKTPIGSVYKKNLSRSLVQLEKGDSGSDRELQLLLRHGKANFGPQIDDIGVKVTFDGSRIIVQRVDPADTDGLFEKLSPKEQIASELRDRRGGTVKDLAEAMGLKERTIANNLTALRKSGRADSDEGGVWRLTD